jgi:hypothetical protein
MASGIVPIRLVEARNKRCKLVMVSTDSGIDPCKLFEERLISIKLLRAPMFSGIVPNKLSSFRKRETGVSLSDDEQKN